MPSLVLLLFVSLSVFSCSKESPPVGPNIQDIQGSTQKAAEYCPTFQIEFMFLDSLDISYRLHLERAAWRWESVILNDPTPIDFSYQPYRPYDEHLGQRFVVDEPVDDLLVVVAEKYQRHAIASASVALVRTIGQLPVVATLALDVDELNQSPSEEVYRIMLHELAHCLGFGQVWDNLNLVRYQSGQAYFTGSNALVMFRAVGGDRVRGPGVPIAPDLAHWQPSIFADELMALGWHTPFERPLSAVTVAQFADLGYTVEWLGADNYSVPTTRAAKPTAHHHQRGEIRHVDEKGRIVR